MNNFRICQNDLGFQIFSSRDVNYGKPDALADLRRGQPHSLRSIHGREHIFGQFFQLGIKLLNRRSGSLEHWVAILHDVV
jgi:hypothetical protein